MVGFTMSLELDHVFCFCEPKLPEIEVAQKLGFIAFPERTHQDQGTSNRCIVFEENYLEFIYLSSREESQKNELKLHQRADWKSTKASPFGIALRGVIPEKYKNDFWEYKPAYAKGKSIFIHKFTQEHPEAPLLFVIPLPGGASVDAMKPSNSLHLDKGLLKHKSGSTRIKAIRISSPVALPEPFKISSVEVEISSEPHMTAQLDGILENAVIGTVLSISGR
jgi:hypothetical protein